MNLSPGLSNDCEIDSEVKKPLLHDLFDLLGLPVCNTGLSLFTIWSAIDDEVEMSSKYCANRTMKKKSRTYRETDGFLNICTELRPTVRIYKRILVNTELLAKILSSILILIISSNIQPPTILQICGLFTLPY